MAADPKQEVFRGEKRNKFNKAKVSDWRHIEKICVFQSVVLAGAKSWISDYHRFCMEMFCFSTILVISFS